MIFIADTANQKSTYKTLKYKAISILYIYLNNDLKLHVLQV
jgi:hypothetical protein